MYLILFIALSFTFVFMFSKTAFAGENNMGAWGDQGDGTYNNPVLPGDYSDPDIIRVDNDYYMITSTFQLSPGLTVLHSVDLVNWEFIGVAVRDITQMSARYNYTSMDGYGEGIWAPCITYNKNNKTFYIHFGTPKEGYFMVKTTDIYGEWSDVFEVKKTDGTGFGAGWDDCGVLWDDDGTGYFIGANFSDDYQSWLYKISDDGYTLLDKGIPVHRTFDDYNPEEKAPEAYKIFKKDGIYYFFHNGVYGPDRRAWLMRSENIYGKHTDGSMGTFENPGKYEHCPFYITDGYRGPCQGNIVDANTEDGVKWYFWTHQGSTQVDGRPDSLLPLIWEDGWAKSEMVWTNIPKPFPNSEVKCPTTSDDFNDNKLGLQWLWNYQPRADKWSLTEREGHIRLYAFKPLETDKIHKAGNTLFQRLYKTQANIVTTKIDISNMENGQNAGLTHSAGVANTNIGVCQIDGKRHIRYTTSKGIDILGTEISGDVNYIYLKSEWKIDCVNQFYYSLDGISYKPFGEQYQLIGSNYRGDYVGIYNYNNLSENGYIDVDYLYYDMDTADNTPIISDYVNI